MKKCLIILICHKFFCFLHFFFKLVSRSGNLFYCILYKVYYLFNLCIYYKAFILNFIKEVLILCRLRFIFWYSLFKTLCRLFNIFHIFLNSLCIFFSVTLSLSHLNLWFFLIFRKLLGFIVVYRKNIFFWVFCFFLLWCPMFWSFFFFLIITVNCNKKCLGFNCKFFIIRNKHP